MNCPCGSAWFVEEKQILSPSEPHSPFISVEPSRERYIYRCAECGLAYGQKPKRRKKAS